MYVYFFILAQSDIQKLLNYFRIKQRAHIVIIILLIVLSTANH